MGIWGRPSDPVKRIVSHNVRGMRDEYADKQEALVEWAKTKHVFVACLQEVWRTGTAVHKNVEVHGMPTGWALITHGLQTAVCARGSQGVGILLSPEAKVAWEKAGSDTFTFGNRILAVRLLMRDEKGRVAYTWIISAYSPVSSTKDDTDDLDVYLGHLQECLDHCGRRSRLIIGTDANAALGIKRGRHDRVLGRHGLPRRNDAGQQLYHFLAKNELCVTTTFFDSRSRRGRERFTTWYHPNTLSTKRRFQNDQIIVRQRDFKLTKKAGRMEVGGVNSDHKAVAMDFKVCTSMRRHSRDDDENGEKPLRIDREKLQDGTVVEQFQEAFRGAFEVRQGDGAHAYEPVLKALKSASEVLGTDAKPEAGWFAASGTLMRTAIERRDQRQQAYNEHPTAGKKASLLKARRHVKIAKRTAINRWHEHVLERVHALNGSCDGFDDNGRPLTMKAIWRNIKLLIRGRSNFEKTATMKLKKPDGTFCENLEENTDVMKEYLCNVFAKDGVFDEEAINLVRQRAVQHQMDSPPSKDEVLAAVKKMNNWRSGGDAKIPAEYFKALCKGYDKDDKSETTVVCVAALVSMYEQFWTTGSYPGEEEISRRIHEEAGRRSSPPAFKIGKTLRGKGWSLKWRPFNPKNGGGRTNKDSYERYDAYKKARDYETFIDLGLAHFEAIGESRNRVWQIDKLHNDLRYDYNKGFVSTTPPPPPSVELSFDDYEDEDGMVVDEWLIARCKLLPKKGDLGLCKNWRGICLLDIASKILDSVMVRRLQEVMEKEGMESQTGFRYFRGTIDGAFTVINALRKRQEHNLQSFVAFIDLIKAFDSVPRAALWKVLLKFGFPRHFVRILMRLHTDAVMKFKINDQAEDADVASMIGVRQGSNSGPVLFLFIMQAAMETMKWPVDEPQFCTIKDGAWESARLYGESSTRKDGVHWFTLPPSLFADDCAVVFENRNDMEVGMTYMIQHLARFGLMVHVGRGTTSSKTECMFFPRPREPVNGADLSNVTVTADGGFISFVDKFRYLGSHIGQSLDSDVDVEERLTKASQAFGALRKHTFANKDVKPETKARLYVALVLGVLLYGCESWFLREKEFKKMQRFHHDCVRTMLRVNRHQQWRRRIKMTDLFTDLGNKVRPLRWHYETRLLRWAGHISRMKHDRLPLMLLYSWVPNPRPRGCPRMTFGRTIKKAMKRRPEIWPELKFTEPENWSTLSEAARRRLLEAHDEKKREHDIKMQTHWRTLAADKDSWQAMVRGPEPEPVDRAPAARRARRSRNHHRHDHQEPPPQQPVHFQPAVIPHNYQQHAGNFNDMDGNVVHRNFDD